MQNAVASHGAAAHSAADALIIGATGLVGSHLLRQLLEDERFGSVTVFTRRSTGVRHPRLHEHVVSFDDIASWRDRVTGDVLFSALGTTISAAGSRDAQWRVDHTYQLETARAAAANGVATCVLVSAAGAAADSRVFYSRMKGELERDIAALGFRHLHILRPGLLAGPRAEKRAGERIAGRMLRALNAVGLFRKYRPIHADVVARAMIRASMRPERVRILAPDELFDIAAGTLA
jgi:uncharacterized protein YbjT (DUF2867 family)